MNITRVFLPEKYEVPCTVEVENTFESLHAHVTLPEDVVIEPGDEVIVHGNPIRVPYGQSWSEERMATVVHASLAVRSWTRLTGDLEFMELFEFSFSGEKDL